MKIVDIALSQEGTPERGLNNTIYNTWYYGYSVSGGSYPYCAVFVSWCAEQAGLSTDILPRTASVTSLYNFFLEKNLFKKSKEYIPSPGDIMIQRSHGISHTGIVVLTDNNGFYTIEGNAGVGIERKYYPYTNSQITGFGTPQYPIEIATKWNSQISDSIEEQPTIKLRNTSRLMTTTASDANTSGTTAEANYGTVPNSSDTKVIVTSPQMSEEEIWNWFRSHGYSSEATAGIMGRMQQEHNFLPTYATFTYEPGIGECGGFGMFQWTYDTSHGYEYPDYNEGRKVFPNSRLASYLDWCDQNGYEYETCLGQLEYFWAVDKDLKGSHSNADFSPANMNTMTIDEAADYWTNEFEVGQPGSEHEYAAQIYAKYKNLPVTNVISSTGEVPHTTGMRQTGNVSFDESVGSYTYETYSVKDGDTLESIALQYNVAPQMIYFANSLSKWEVTPGKTLYIPVPDKRAGILSRAEAVNGVDSLKNLEHNMKIEVSFPTVEVMFYGEYGKLSAKTTLVDVKNEQADRDVVSINTSRNQGQDCPTFSVSLVWRNEWYNLLASNDLVVIYMQRPPEDNHPVMFGLIDDVRRSIDWSSGQPQRTVQITGRGFNKALCQFDIGFIDAYSGLVKEGKGFFAGLTSMGALGSAKAIDKTLQAYIGKGLKYSFGNGKTFENLLGIDLSAEPGEILYDIQSFTTFNGSMWNFIRQLGNAPFNETFWEIKNDKPTIIHRPTPFEKDKWITLNRITIKDYDLVNNGTGRSDLETYTVYRTVMAKMEDASRPTYLPIWYPPYYSKYGLKLLEVTSLYKTQGTGNLDFNPVGFTRKLFNFNIKNPLMENGSLTVKGSNQYKVGERVILESEDMEYYVEGVTHSFNMYSSWITTLQVTRGLHPAERFTPPYGSGEDLSPDKMNAIIEMSETSGAVQWWNIKKGNYGSVSASGVSTLSSRQGRIVGADGQWYEFNNTKITWPAPECTIITSPYGPRDTGIAGASTYHKGIDLACEGDAMGKPIVSVADGTVTYAGPGDGYGNFIIIDHGNGWTTRYAHMFDDGILVTEGQMVKAGTHIANIGNAGVGSGAHLHFESRIDGEAMNPETLFQTTTTAPEDITLQSTDDAAYNTIDVNASKEEIASSCYSYITTRMGLGKCAACAILGNIEQESTFNMVAVNGKSGATGLCQWLGSRKTELFAYCSEHGVEVNSVAGQMGYLYQELQTTESAGFSVLQSKSNGTRNDVYQLAVDFGEAFERYGANEEGSRGTYAVQWWDYFSNSN